MGNRYTKIQVDVESIILLYGYGIPNQLDQLRCLGNAVVPQVAEYISSLIVKHNNKMRGCDE